MRGPLELLQLTFDGVLAGVRRARMVELVDEGLDREQVAGRLRLGRRERKGGNLSSVRRDEPTVNATFQLPVRLSHPNGNMRCMSGASRDRDSNDIISRSTTTT